MGKSEEIVAELLEGEVDEFRRKDYDLYKRLLGQIERGFKKVSDAYIGIACSLWQIYHNEYFRIDNYKNIGDFAYERFGIKKSTTHSYIKIIERFGNINDGKVSNLKEEFKPFSCSQLASMVTFTPEQLEQVNPDWSVREIIEFGKCPLHLESSEDEENLEDEEEMEGDAYETESVSDYMTTPEIESGRTFLGEFNTLDDVVKNREIYESAYQDMCNDSNFKNRKIRFVLELVFD